jgi:hypothetical protein
LIRIKRAPTQLWTFVMQDRAFMRSVLAVIVTILNSHKNHSN